jgi:hypothetical protein
MKTTGDSSVDLVAQIVRELAKDPEITVGGETSLLGDNRILDSLGLVELCLRLEDCAVEDGFEFDWISDVAMSRSQSMFRTVTSLATEFDRQKNEQA